MVRNSILQRIKIKVLIIFCLIYHLIVDKYLCPIPLFVPLKIPNRGFHLHDLLSERNKVLNFKSNNCRRDSLAIIKGMRSGRRKYKISKLMKIFADQIRLRKVCQNIDLIVV